MALVEKAFGDIITFTRASGGGRINALGQYEWVAANVPRLTHDPVTLQPLGLLVEEQRTNLLLNSVLAGGTAGIVGAGAVAPTNWVFGSGGGLIAYGTSPLGAASFLTTKTTTADRPFLQRTFTAIANTAYTLSARVVSVSGVNQIADLIEPAARPAGSSVTYAVNGVVVSGTDTPSLKAWDLISTTVQVGETGGAVFLRLGIGAARPTAPIGSVELTMPMFEVGLSPSSYIPTEASQVTRAADVCSVNTLSPWYNPLEGTIVVKAISSPSQPAPISESYAALRGASINDRIEIVKVTAQINITGAVVAGGVAQANMNGVTLPPNTGFSAAMSYKANDFAFSLNGGAVATDNSGSVPVVTLLQIGSRSSASQCNGIISEITYHPRVIDVQQASA